MGGTDAEKWSMYACAPFDMEENLNGETQFEGASEKQITVQVKRRVSVRSI